MTAFCARCCSPRRRRSMPGPLEETASLDRLVHEPTRSCTEATVTLANWAVRVVPQRWTGRWIGGIGCALASDVDGAINSRHAEFTRGTVPDRPYQRVTVNLYADETAWLDHVCERL